MRAWCLSDGCPYSKPEGVYKLDAAEVRAWCEATGRTGRCGPRELGGKKDKSRDASGEPRDPKERKLYWDARKAKVMAMLAEGTALDAAEVRTANVRKVSAVKQGLLSLPSKVAGRLAHRSQREIETELTDAVRALLTEFAAGEFDGE